jgi:hypothetical protein
MRIRRETDHQTLPQFQKAEIAFAALEAKEEQKPASPRANANASASSASASATVPRIGLSRAISIIPDAAMMQRKTSLNRVEPVVPKTTPADTNAAAAISSAVENQLSAKLPSVATAPAPAPTGGVREMAQVFEVAGISDQVCCDVVFY